MRPGDTKLESRPPEHLDVDARVNKFDFFQKFVDISIYGSVDKQYFFPVFLKANISDKEAQINGLYNFVLENKELFKSKKLILIMVDILEAMDRPDVNLVHDLALKLKNICTVYLIDGDRDRKKLNHAYVHYYVLQWIHHALNESPREVISLNQNHKTFIFLNKMGRRHRVHTINEVLKNGLREHGYITFTKETRCCGEWPLWYPLVKNTKFDILDFDNVLQVNPTQYAPLKYCEDSFLFLNTETYCDNSRFFLTEKTFKPIRLGMPFVTVANPGTLAYLRTMGFKTFNEWIDESYDLVTSEDEKIEKVVKEVVRFSKMTNNDRMKIRQEMIPTLHHNQQLAEELTHGKMAMVDILNDIEKREQI